MLIILSAEVKDKYQITKEELESLLGYCNFEEIVSDLIFGKDENTG